MKPFFKNNNHEFYSLMGKRGAAIRWANHEHQEDQDLLRAYEDRKGEWYCRVVRKDGKVMECYHSTGRRDRLDIYVNNCFDLAIGKRNLGNYIGELI